MIERVSMEQILTQLRLSVVKAYPRWAYGDLPFTLTYLLSDDWQTRKIIGIDRDNIRIQFQVDGYSSMTFATEVHHNSIKNFLRRYYVGAIHKAPGRKLHIQLTLVRKDQ